MSVMISTNYFRIDISNITFDSSYYYRHIVLYIFANSMNEACSKMIRTLKLISRKEVSVKKCSIQKLVSVDSESLLHSMNRLKHIIKEVDGN